MIQVGAVDCYTKFIAFVEDFSDMIFICGLIGCCIWNILRLFVFGSLVSPDIITFHKWINFLICIYMLVFAYIIYVHMSGGEEDD